MNKRAFKIPLAMLLALLTVFFCCCQAVPAFIL